MKPTSFLAQVECLVQSTEVEVRLYDEGVIAPWNVHRGGWDEVVTPLELGLKVQYWIQREGRKRVSNSNL